MKKTQADHHGLKAGDSVIVFTVTGQDGNKIRHLFMYDTAASFHEDFLRDLGRPFERTREPWNGEEQISFDNGD